MTARPGRPSRTELTATVVFAASVLVICATWFFGIGQRARLFSLDIQIVRTSGIHRVFTSGVSDATDTFTLIALGTAGYLGALWALRRGFKDSFPAAIAACVLAGAAFLPSMPMTSPDAVHLAADVRTFWLYHRYPTHVENAPAKVDDPVTQQVVVFPNSPSGYGPLSYAIGGAALPFTGDGLRGNVLGVKIVAGAFLVLTAYLAGLLARRLGQNAALATAMVGLNPLMLWEFPGDGHNDSIMVAFGVLALLFLVQRNWASRGDGIGAAVASVFSKFALVIAAPVIAAAWFPRLRLAMAALIAVAGVALVVLVGSGWRPDFSATGPATAIAKTTPWGVIANVTDAGPDGKDRLITAALASFMAILALIVWRHPLEKPQDIVAAIGLLLWLFLFVSSPGLLPWYQLWYFPFAVLSGRRWLVVTALVFSVGGFLPILALNWSGDMAREWSISEPVDRAVEVLWLVTTVTALAMLSADRRAGRGVSARAQRQTGARAARRRAARSRA